MAQNKKNTESRKQIAFDLSQKALAANYPRPRFSLSPKYYKKAYSDISRFMEKNGFEHRQFSVYTSIGQLTGIDINLLMDDLAKEMPWLTRCVNQIDVTGIGLQHSLLQTLEAATALHLDQERPEPVRAARPHIHRVVFGIGGGRDAGVHAEHHRPGGRVKGDHEVFRAGAVPHDPPVPELEVGIEPDFVLGPALTHLRHRGQSRGRGQALDHQKRQKQGYHTEFEFLHTGFIPP